MSENKKRRYWSTLEQYENHANFDKVKNEEFFAKPEDAINEDLSIRPDVENESRRDFLKLSGAAAVLSLVACAERPVERILPYVNAPDDSVPGIANYYASSSDEANRSVLIKTREGRPINIIPNNLDSSSGTGLTARAYASLIDLYDASRAKSPLKLDRKGMGSAVAWADAFTEIGTKIKESKGQTVLLSSTLNGVSRTRLLKQLGTELPNFKHIMVDANSDDNLTEATNLTLAKNVLPRYRFDRANVLVFLGGDAVADGREITTYAHAIAQNRKVNIKQKDMSRIFSFEPTMTEIGANADYRYNVKNEDMASVALALANEIVIGQKASKFAGNSAVESVLANFSAQSVEKTLGLKEGTIKKVASSLLANAGKSVVYSEGLANRTINGKALHIATNFLNAALENTGKTIDYTHSYGKHSLGSTKALDILVDDMASGKVSTVILYNTNPTYFYHNSAKLTEGFAKVATLVSLNDRLDETSVNFDYLLPSTHILESWGDREYINGLHTIVQPTINPIWDNKSAEESLMNIAAACGSSAFENEQYSTMDYYSYTQQSWQEVHKAFSIASSFEAFWVSVVRDGFFETVKDRNTDGEALAFNVASLSQIALKETSKNLTLSLFMGSTLGDGKSGNNPYLYELPDPVSKICWDNFLALAPATARELGVWIGDLADVTFNGNTYRIPVNIQPGTHLKVATIAVGWGRKNAGPIGAGKDNNGLGLNAFAFAKDGLYSGAEITVKKVGEYQLADLQGHQYLDEKQRFLEIHDHKKENYRQILFESSLNEYIEKPEDVVKYHSEELTDQVKNNKIPNMWNLGDTNVHKYPGHKWGMVIDLNSCVGCNACVIACQVENNVPVVGKAEVIVGREMHWIRIDRYYVGDENDPKIINQPMMCQHCDNAPCETVCPVVATTHNGEGLNVMTYNRCVGTRYCANNCPYKVRRFNFHEYTKGDASKGMGTTEVFGLSLGRNDGLNQFGYSLKDTPMSMMLNPDVLVREKGVMEKCSMCNHKIRESKYEAKLAGVSMAELDNLNTACSTACPANAITFGDMNDETSMVYKLKKEHLNFSSLAELNTSPAVSYLAKIRNQEEKLAHVEEEHSNGAEHTENKEAETKH